MWLDLGDYGGLIEVPDDPSLEGIAVPGPTASTSTAAAPAPAPAAPAPAPTSSTAPTWDQLNAGTHWTRTGYVSDPNSGYTAFTMPAANSGYDNKDTIRQQLFNPAMGVIAPTGASFDNPYGQVFYVPTANYSQLTQPYDTNPHVQDNPFSVIGPVLALASFVFPPIAPFATVINVGNAVASGDPLSIALAAVGVGQSTGLIPSYSDMLGLGTAADTSLGGVNTFGQTSGVDSAVDTALNGGTTSGMGLDSVANAGFGATDATIAPSLTNALSPSGLSYVPPTSTSSSPGNITPDFYGGVGTAGADGVTDMGNIDVFGKTDNFGTPFSLNNISGGSLLDNSPYKAPDPYQTVDHTIQDIVDPNGTGPLNGTGGWTTDLSNSSRLINSEQGLAYDPSTKSYSDWANDSSVSLPSGGTGSGGSLKDAIDKYGPYLKDAAGLITLAGAAGSSSGSGGGGGSSPLSSVSTGNELNSPAYTGQRGVTEATRFQTKKYPGFLSGGLSTTGNAVPAANSSPINQVVAQ